MRAWLGITGQYGLMGVKGLLFITMSSVALDVAPVLCFRRLASTLSVLTIIFPWLFWTFSFCDQSLGHVKVTVQLPSFRMEQLEVAGTMSVGCLAETIGEHEASVNGRLSHRGVVLSDRRLLGEVAEGDPEIRVRFHPAGSLFNGGGGGVKLKKPSKCAFLDACAEEIAARRTQSAGDEGVQQLCKDNLKLAGFTQFTTKWLEENVLRYPDATLQNLRNAFQRAKSDGTLLKVLQLRVQGLKPAAAPKHSQGATSTSPLDSESKKVRLKQIKTSALGKLLPPSGREQVRTKPRDHSCLTGLDTLSSAERRYLGGIVQLYTTAYVQVTGNRVTWRDTAPKSLWVQPPDPILSGKFADPFQHRLPRVFLATYEDFPHVHPLLPKPRPQCPSCRTDSHVIGHGYRIVRVLSRDGQYFALTKYKRCNNPACATSGTHHFNACNEAAMASVLPHIRGTIPFHLSSGHASAVDKQLIRDGVADISSGRLQPTQFLRSVREHHASIDVRKELNFYRGVFAVEAASQENNLSPKWSATRWPPYQHITGHGAMPHVIQRELIRRSPLADMLMETTLPAKTNVVSGDATFKIASVCRSHGGRSSTFSNMFTVMSGEGAVLFQQFCFGKSLLELRPAFQRLAERISSAGVDLAAVYTDNCCQDRSLLEEAFASCLRPEYRPAVIAIPAARPTWNRDAHGFGGVVNIKGTLAMIHQLQKMDYLDINHLILDCQWTRAIVSPTGRRKGAAPIAELQLAFRDPEGLCQVVVFHLPDIVRGAGQSKRPLHAVGQFLDRHKVVGVHIRMKLEKLARDYGLALHIATSNAVELAHLAYDSLIVDDRGSSLDEIVSSARNEALPLLSPRLYWEGTTAVGNTRGVKAGPVERDVVVSRVSATLAMFELSLQRHREVSQLPSYGENVVLHDLRGKRLALGTLVKPRDVEEISRPPQQVLVRVNVPLCPRRRVAFVDEAGGGTGHMLLADFVPRDRPLLSAICSPQQVSKASAEVMARLANRRVTPRQAPPVPEATSSSKATGSKKTPAPREHKEEPQEINFGPGIGSDEGWYGRVRLDAFHALQRISGTLSKQHELFQHFMSELRDSMFIVTDVERQRVRDELRCSGWTRERINDLEAKRTKAFLRLCQRTIPGPDQLWGNLNDTFTSFRDRVDTNGVSLFSGATEVEIAKLKVHVERGCLSDPPDAQLYFYIGADGSRRLRCVRGTSSLEGYHKAIRSLLSCRFRNPETMHYALTIFNQRWNIAALHRVQGLPVPFHFELEDLQEIARLASHFGHTQYSHLPNLDDVEPRESFGVRAAEVQHSAMDDWSSAGSLSGSESESDPGSPRPPDRGTAARSHDRQSSRAAEQCLFVDACFTPSAPSEAERALFDTLLAKFNNGGKINFTNVKRDWGKLAKDGFVRPASTQLLKEYSEKLAGRAGRNLARAAYHQDTNELRAKRQARAAASATSRAAHTPSEPTVVELDAGGLYRRMAIDARVAAGDRTARLTAMGYGGLLPRPEEKKIQLCARCHHAWAHPDLQRHGLHQMVNRGKRVCTTPSAVHVDRVGRIAKEKGGRSTCEDCYNFQLGAHAWAMPAPPPASSRSNEHSWTAQPCGRDVGISVATCGCPPLSPQEAYVEGANGCLPENCASENANQPVVPVVPVVSLVDDDVAVVSGNGVNLYRPDPNVYRQTADGVWTNAIDFDRVLAIGKVAGNQEPWLETVTYQSSTPFETVLIHGDPLSDPRPAGLFNPHTTCYANAAVKFLLSSPAVANSLLSGSNTGRGLLIQALQDVADTQVPGVALVASCQPVLSAVEGLTNWSHAGDDGQNQHDANQFLTCLLDALSPKLPDDQTVEPPWLSSFQIGVTSSQQCSRCSSFRKVETFDTKSLLLSATDNSVQDMLEGIGEPVIEDGGPIFCACGASNEDLPTVTRLHAAQPHLWVETEDVQCISERVHLPRKATLDGTSAEYEVVAAMIFHDAHWVTAARHPLSPHWYLHDDKHVQVLPEGPSAYLPVLRSKSPSTRVKALLLWRISGRDTDLAGFHPANCLPWSLEAPDDAQSAAGGVRQPGCVDITNHMLHLLRKGEWLNGSLIDQMGILAERHSPSSLYLRETFALCLGNARARLANTVQDKHVLTQAYRKADSVFSKWLKGRDLNSIGVFVQPLCVDGSHWVTVAVDLTDNVIRVYDSLDPGHVREAINTYLDNLCQFFEHKSLEFPQKILFHGRLRQEIVLDDHGERFNFTICPQQDNGCDCGVFTTIFCTAELNGYQQDAVRSLKMVWISAARRQIARDVLRCDHDPASWQCVRMYNNTFMCKVPGRSHKAATKKKREERKVGAAKKKKKGRGQ